MPSSPAVPGPDPLGALSRRTLLRGAAALGLVGAAGGLGLAACGDDDGDAGGDGAATDPGAGEETGPVLVSMTPPGILAAGEEARVVVAVGEAGTGALVTDAPEVLTFAVETADGEPVADGLEVARHADGLPRAYYPLAVTVPAAGFYRAVTEVDGTRVDAAFEVAEPDAVPIPRPGQPFPSAATPTTADPAGVDPICTREPACGLHEVDVASALGTAPLAVLVSTPAFCATAICGPVLEVLLEARETAPDVTFVHVEVYASAEEVNDQGPQGATLAPAVDGWGLPFEPCLFLVAADGTLQRRLDVVFDRAELADALAALIS